jgi:hypothetical protein
VSDTNERSGASTGSVGDPQGENHLLRTLCKALRDVNADLDGRLLEAEGLARQIGLSNAERDALEFVVERGHIACGYEKDLLRGLLERTK